MYAVGVLFNHEPPTRPVTRKITRGLCRIDTGIEVPSMGNLDAKRDWGHARDYVEMQWRMLQQDHRVRYRHCQERCAASLNSQRYRLGQHHLKLEEVGCRADSGAAVRIDPRYFRPSEVETLLGIPPRRENWDGPRQRWRNW